MSDLQRDFTRRGWVVYNALIFGTAVAAGIIGTLLLALVVYRLLVAPLL